MEDKKSSPRQPVPGNPEDAHPRGDEPGRRDELLDRIKVLIREMPAVEPPAELLAAVMEAVEAKSYPWWLRAYRWVRSPKSVTFTPLHMAPALAFSVLLVISILHFYVGENRNTVFNQAQGIIPVTLSLHMPEARSVQVIGSFNNWVPQPCELRKNNGASAWTMTLKLPPGRYEYVFVVDGEKIVPDPGAELYQDDGFGNRNNVLAVGNKDEAI